MFHTSVTDLRQPFVETVETFPYECGWADEAIFFVTAETGTDESAQVSLGVQLSADGIRWLDEGSVLTLRGPASGFVRVTHFGGFLRLAGTVAGGTTNGATLTVRLALKG
ncbi:hypothetical protein GCM10025867_18420 [Frondihabitans sucicola]|uniref:Uncharacterized protein n=1 Tax=Frondihabitans sucicola TaxID=1268041 RepID=A0ABM8GMK2_9MICO|nr:hypothetical protein [Frondihabitans sucicola]BDZ49601.1 hypothetical protein GCM10025867_18420 [Frondihabitans sucicola]